MRDLLLELKASTHGEPFRLVATGVSPFGGSAQFSTAKPLPQELLRALNYYLDEIDVDRRGGSTARRPFRARATLSGGVVLICRLRSILPSEIHTCRVQGPLRWMELSL